VLSRPANGLRRLAETILTQAGSPPGVRIDSTDAYVGGGALPEQALPSVGIVFDPSHNANDLMTSFRENSPPIIGRIDKDQFILDLKAVDVDDARVVAEAIRRLLT